MEHLKTFLESSTIHGLQYISTGKKYIRIFWILVVIAGFFGSGVLIYNSFQSWEQSPVKTTIETLEITKLVYPKVTVCPPKNTYTNLNYDLSMAENITLDNDTRKEYASFAATQLHQHLYAISTKNLSFLEDINRYYNWYHGYTKISLPYIDEDHLNYRVDTAATSGTIVSK